MGKEWKKTTSKLVAKAKVKAVVPQPVKRSRGSDRFYVQHLSMSQRGADLLSIAALPSPPPKVDIYQFFISQKVNGFVG